MIRLAFFFLLGLLGTGAYASTPIPIPDCPSDADVCIEFSGSMAQKLTTDPLLREAVTNAIQKNLTQQTHAVFKSVSYTADHVLYEFTWAPNS